MSASDAILRAMSDRVTDARAKTADVARRLNDVLDAAVHPDRFQQHDKRGLDDLLEEMRTARERLLSALDRYYVVAEAHLSGVTAANLLSIAAGFDDMDRSALEQIRERLVKTDVRVLAQNDTREVG